MNNSRTDVEQVHIYLVLGTLFLGYGIFALNGYGNDNDTYGMLNTWRTLVNYHYYVPSRFQGNLIPELVIGLSSQIGGYYLTNIVSATLSVASLFIFYSLVIKTTSSLLAILAVVAIGTNPFWILASTIPMDYIYAIFFYILGVFLLINGRCRIAGLMFALAISSRITYGPMAIIAFLFYLIYIKQRERKQIIFQGIILFFAGIAILYLPVFIASGMNFSFLAFGSDAAGGFLGIVVRFIYKNIFFWSLPTFILLVFFLYKQRRYYLSNIFTNPFAKKIQINHLVFQAVLGVVIYSEIMFARLPHEYNYLLPVLVGVIYLITTNINSSGRIKFLSLIFALNIVYAIIGYLDVIETYQTQSIGQTVHADGAYVKLSIKEGVLVKDFEDRAVIQKYQVNEFNKRWQHTGFKLEERKSAIN